MINVIAQVKHNHLCILLLHTPNIHMHLGHLLALDKQCIRMLWYFARQQKLEFTLLVGVNHLVANQVVHITSTMHRTFTKQHWTHLHTLLTSWKSNLHTIRDQISHLAQAQLEMIHQKKI